MPRNIVVRPGPWLLQAGFVLILLPLALAFVLWDLIHLRFLPSLLGSFLFFVVFWTRLPD